MASGLRGDCAKTESWRRQVFVFLLVKDIIILIRKEEKTEVPLSQLAICTLIEGLGLGDSRHLPGRTRPGHEIKGTVVSMVGGERTSSSFYLETPMHKQGTCWESLEQGQQVGITLPRTWAGGQQRSDKSSGWWSLPETQGTMPGLLCQDERSLASWVWAEALGPWAGLGCEAGLDSRLQSMEGDLRATRNAA